MSTDRSTDRRGPDDRRLSPEQLRSHQWYGTEGQLRTWSHNARMRQLGYEGEEYEGRPVVAVLNTWSDINPCHVHLRERAEAVKRGVWQAGGFPLEFPVSTLSETYQKPTPMLYRNLLAMETEELLRSYPVDAAVLLGGCDKSTPALLMGAASADVAGDLRRRPGRCCRATGAARPSAPAPTCGSTGTSTARATSPTANCGNSRAGWPGRPATA